MTCAIWKLLSKLVKEYTLTVWLGLELEAIISTKSNSREEPGFLSMYSSTVNLLGIASVFYAAILCQLKAAQRHQRIGYFLRFGQTVCHTRKTTVWRETGSMPLYFPVIFSAPSIRTFRCEAGSTFLLLTCTTNVN